MSDSDRLRPHPQQRFDAPAHHFDLAAIAARLRAEPHPSVAGHRQIAIYKGEQTTLVLFAFDRDGVIPDHSADGVVTMQAIRGRLHVDGMGGSYELVPGQVLVLAPGVPHAVRATEPSEMLLTVQMMPGAGSQEAPPA